MGTVEDDGSVSFDKGHSDESGEVEGSVDESEDAEYDAADDSDRPVAKILTKSYNGPDN